MGEQGYDGSVSDWAPCNSCNICRWVVWIDIKMGELCYYYSRRRMLPLHYSRSYQTLTLKPTDRILLPPHRLHHRHRPLLLHARGLQQGSRRLLSLCRHKHPNVQCHLACCRLLPRSIDILDVLHLLLFRKTRPRHGNRPQFFKQSRQHRTRLREDCSTVYGRERGWAFGSNDGCEEADSRLRAV